MCDRYSLRTTPEVLIEAVGGLRLPFADLPRRYNITPKEKCLVVRDTDAGREASLAVWGFLPGFITSARSGQHPTKARAETVATYEYFKDAFATRRCLIPADGFYAPEEDEARPGKEKETGRWWYFKYADDRPFCLGGISAAWGEGEARVESFAVITTEPMAAVERCGNRRSPLIIPPERYDLWLDDTADLPRLAEVLAPLPSDGIVGYPVDGRAKNPREEGPGLIEPTVPPIPA